MNAAQSPRFPVDIERLWADVPGVRTIVLTSPASLLHFAGFASNAYVSCGSPPWGWSPAALIVSRESAYLLVADHQRAEAGDVDATMATYDAVAEQGVEHAFGKALAEIVRSAPPPWGMELPWVSAQLTVAVRAAESDAIDISARTRRLAARKAPWEVARIEAACRAASAAQGAVSAVAGEGVSELELHDAARREIERNVGESILLPCDIVAGERAQRDGEGKPGVRALRLGDTAICDLAPVVCGFFGDSCSTIAIGTIDPVAKRAVVSAEEALRAAADALAPGALASDVDAAARRELTRAGFSCPHHIGHGLGHSQLDHPLIDTGSDAVLEAGHVVALEPGVYVPGVVATRAEHVFAIGEEGVAQLTSHDTAVER